ncbi:hypothetical protein HOI83_00700 [Candidatus Uhrbacteria bacterium]|jgi:hypothetical protein|nr:hypothetical protein [Candidatus Uhrbacteria bacterium]
MMRDTADKPVAQQPDRARSPETLEAFNEFANDFTGALSGEFIGGVRGLFVQPFGGGMDEAYNLKLVQGSIRGELSSYDHEDFGKYVEKAGAVLDFLRVAAEKGLFDAVMVDGERVYASLEEAVQRSVESDGKDFGLTALAIVESNGALGDRLRAKIAGLKAIDDPEVKGMLLKSALAHVSEGGVQYDPELHNEVVALIREHLESPEQAEPAAEVNDPVVEGPHPELAGILENFRGSEGHQEEAIAWLRQHPDQVYDFARSVGDFYAPNDKSGMYDLASIIEALLKEK